MPGALPESLDDVADWLRQHFDPEAARGVDATVQFELRGARGGVLFAEFDDGRMACGQGPAARASAIFRLDADDCFALLACRENGHLRDLGGRVGVEGDPSLAGTLGRLFAAG